MSDLRDYILSKASETLLEFDARAVMAKISKGVTGQGSAEGWDKPKPQAPVKPKKSPKPLSGKYVGPKKPEVTEWKVRIAQILADKIDEIILSDLRNQKTIDPAEFLKKQRVQAAAKNANKPMPKINTDVDVSQYLPKPGTATKSDAVRMSNKSKVESTNLKDRIVDILMEAYRSGYGSSRRRRETPRERQDRMDNDARDAYWSGKTDSQGNVNPDKVAPGGSDEGHKDSPQGHR